MHTDAPSSLAARARSLGEGASWSVRRIVGCAPRAPSSAARSAAINIVASDSDRPLGPTMPGSSGPWPGSIATHEPTNVCSSSMRRTSSVSRTTARLGPSPPGRSRSIEPIVSGPTMPSEALPTLCWNSATAAAVREPKIPSSRPASNPSAFSRFWSSRTSSPWNDSERRYRTRSPSRYPASTSSPHVSGPTIPSEGSPRCCWKAFTASSVEGPNRPSSSSGSIRSPKSRRRRWMSRTASPRSPRRMIFTVRSVRVVGEGPFCRSRMPTRLRSQVRIDLPEQGFLAPCSNHTGLLLPALDQHEGGYAHDPLPPGDLRVLVDVQLGHPQGLALLLADLLDHRRDHVAGHTPLGPEVHQHGLIRLQHAFIEILVRHITDHCQLRSFRLPGARPLPLERAGPASIRLPIVALVRLGCQEPLGVHSCLAPLSGRSHCLTVHPVGDVPRGEHAGNVRRGARLCPPGCSPR